MGALALSVEFSGYWAVHTSICLWWLNRLELKVDPEVRIRGLQDAEEVLWPN
jgi:hypothetical protein